MAANIDAYTKIRARLDDLNIKLIAVSKTKPVAEIMELYQAGHRDFGENYVQELLEKHTQLPRDINWHFIGHLQTNKVKYIAPFIYLIQGIDSEKLLLEVEKQGARSGRKINVLLQVHISKDETKFGFDEDELNRLVEKFQANNYLHLSITGLMGLATFTEDNDLIMSEFRHLKSVYDQYAGRLGFAPEKGILSMGMSADYMLAAEAGSTMVRIGSLLFGERHA